MLKFVQIRHDKNKCVCSPLFKFLISSRNILSRNFNLCSTEVVLTKIVYIYIYFRILSVEVIVCKKYYTDKEKVSSTKTF